VLTFEAPLRETSKAKEKIMNTMFGTNSLVKQCENDGFAVIRNVVDIGLIEEARRHVEWLTKKYLDVQPERFHHPLIRDGAFWVRLVIEEKLLDIVELFLGPNLACFTAHYICKPPFSGQPVLWHQDGASWKLEPVEAITQWLAVEERTPENGCLRTIPGCHNLPPQRPEKCTGSPNMLFSSIGTPRHGVNNYRAYPQCSSEKTIQFKEYENWIDKPQKKDSANSSTESESVVDITLRMIERLQERTLKD
jgi:Phytanoyl-CoA dioxygenase (PhyH)